MSAPSETTAPAMAGYGVTVTRTLKTIGRFCSPESAREFVLGLADSGQLAPSDWETTITVELLDKQAAPETPAPRAGEKE